MLSKQQVQHIAKLARLGLTQAEIEKFQKELSSILDYFEALKKVNVSKIEPTSQAVKIENVMREDKPKPETVERIKKLVEAAPEKEKGYLKVKSVF